jgi:hypothetical protein
VSGNPSSEKATMYETENVGLFQVHREKTSDPAGQSYSIVLIVQHHPLFITMRDKAFSISCLYRDQENRLEQKLEIS